MAKAVTLKNNNNEEVYPVTDTSQLLGIGGRQALLIYLIQEFNWWDYSHYEKIDYNIAQRKAPTTTTKFSCRK